MIFKRERTTSLLSHIQSQVRKLILCQSRPAPNEAVTQAYRKPRRIDIYLKARAQLGHMLPEVGKSLSFRRWIQ